MRDMVDIEVIKDDSCLNPKITIRAKERTTQVENIIDAIENVSGNDFPAIPALQNDKIILLSQRDIVRVYVHERKLTVETDKESFIVRKTLSAILDSLNPGRFFQISQSEVINLYKVKSFDVNIAGTIGIEFDNGAKSWVARSRVKELKKLIDEWSDKKGGAHES